jgi:hypothetical protein
MSQLDELDWLAEIARTNAAESVPKAPITERQRERVP